MWIWLIQAVLVGLFFGITCAVRKAHSGKNLFLAVTSAMWVNFLLMLLALVYLGFHNVDPSDGESLVMGVTAWFAPWLSVVIGYGVVLAFKPGTTSPAKGSRNAENSQKESASPER